jgi:hypothetical protein
MPSKAKVTGHFILDEWYYDIRLSASIARQPRESIMLKFIQTTRIPSTVFGAAALIALISASPLSPAAAQGVPAGLLRLDSSQPSQINNALAEVQQPKVRAAYAHVRKHHNTDQ